MKLINKKFIPVNEPHILNQDAKKVYNIIKSGWISSEGKEVVKLEKKFSKFIGCKYGIAVANGTAALEVAIKSLGLKKGDQVIMPNFTIISNLLAVIKQGCKPIFIDCDKHNWNMNINEIAKKINKKTKAIIATHIYNYPLEIDKIKKICKKKNIYLIEDAAEVLGLRYKNKYCGSYGDISTFSFYANKHITTGEGGIILTNKNSLYKKCHSLKNLCFGTDHNRFNHDDIGWNYRLSNIQAVLALSQLKRINKIVKKKIQVGKTYYSYLKNNKNIYFPKPKINNLENIYWVNAILISKKTGYDSKKLSKKLLDYNIQTRPFFWPMNEQKILKKLNISNKGKFPNSRLVSRYGLYLPSSISLNNKTIKYICKVINYILG